MVMVNYIKCYDCGGYDIVEVDKVEDLTRKPDNAISICMCNYNEPLGWACPRCHMVWALTKCEDGCPTCKTLSTDKTSESFPGKIIHVMNITKTGRVAVCGYTDFYDKIIPPTSKKIDTVNCVNCLNTNYLVTSN